MMELLNQILSFSSVAKAGLLILSILLISTLLLFIFRKVKPDTNWNELSSRIKSWWIMATFFFGAIAVNKNVSLLFFGLMSFWALKEYYTILDTRRADHRVIFWSFVAIPIQYYFAGISWYGLFIIFIPVYMFLFIPIRLVLVQETQGFLLSTARIQWGIMAFIFCLSHMGFLLILPPLPGFNGCGGQSMLLFLVITTEMNDIFQYIWGKSFGKRKILPIVSPKKTWEGFAGGVLTTSVSSLGLIFLVPFSALETMMIAFLIGVSGFCGDVVMSAIKRDVGVKDFGTMIPGHGGILDRVDSLCYTAPLFFHIVYYLYY